MAASPLVLRPATPPRPAMEPQGAIVAAVDQPTPVPAHPKPGMFRRAALRLAAHLSPLGKAEAATLPREAARPTVASERWGIQLGAFHAPSAAEKAARDAAGASPAHGKPVQIVDTGKTARTRLYHARLVNLTPREAQSACAQLRRKNIECSVIPPAVR
jgi:hypothetical protein